MTSEGREPAVDGGREIPKWPRMRQVKHGVHETALKSWEQFHDVVTHKRWRKLVFAYRGQRRNDWLLKPSLSRLALAGKKMREIRQQQLEDFQYAIRGRRGSNPALVKKGDELWALGRHYELATPLLDWTSSPYVALFHAFAEIDEDGGDDVYEPPADRAFWEERASKDSLVVVDECLGLLRGIVPSVEPRYKRNYVGLTLNGSAQNFVVFRPKKQWTRVSARLDELDPWVERLETAGIIVLEGGRAKGKLIFTLTKGDVHKHETLLRELFTEAYGGKKEE